MSKQDKTTSEKFAKTLRELVKRPENKVCADCKRNDPRWASWNLGVFLCIRCSGLHRGMGTHISKVKSVDLDVWTPEQMGSIQKWGNHLANLYWEAHLKSGHVPPEHKMESFIRSKYESKRWAMEGPVPDDPSVLDSGTPPAIQAAPASEQASSSLSHSAATRTFTPISTTGQRQLQTHQLLSSNYANRPIKETPSGPSQSTLLPPPRPETAPALRAQAPENDLFSLDFRAPPVSTSSVPEPKKDVKQDILSLFSPTSAAVAAPIQTTSTTLQNYNLNWQGAVPQQQSVGPTSMMGTSGTGLWGASSGWAGSVQVMPPQPNIWNAPTTAAQPQPNIFDTNSIWGSTSSNTTTAQDPWASTTNAVQKKDEVFGDIWGGFK